MLLFIDEPRHLRIVRQGDAGGSREPIGRIRKHESEIPDEMMSRLQQDEVTEVNAALALLAEAEVIRLKALIAALPNTLREIVDYFKHEANPVEQRWIKGSIQEALRIVRRHEREAHERENASSLQST